VILAAYVSQGPFLAMNPGGARELLSFLFCPHSSIRDMWNEEEPASLVVNINIFYGRSQGIWNS
jgi:hypothetical protein